MAFCCLDGPQFVYPSPTEGCLGGFQVLVVAIVNIAAVNIRVVGFCVDINTLSVPLDKYRVQLLDHMVKSVFRLVKATTVFHSASSFCTPTNSECESCLNIW